MLAELLSIILRSIKLDKSLYKDNKNFGEASIYYAILIILLGSIISIIPNSSFLNYMNLNFNLGVIKGCLLYTSPSPRDVEESRMPSSA